MRTSAEDRSHLDPNAPEPLRVLLGDPNWAKEWRETVDGMHLRKLAMGQNHVIARELLLTMSPEWAEARTPNEIKEWAQANVDWLLARFGPDRVKLVVLHGDEQTEHIAAYVIGLKADPKKRGNGWTLSDRSIGLGGKSKNLVTLQDEYAQAMKKFGLKRGIKGSKATHKKTAQWRKEQAQALPAIKALEVEPPSLSDRLNPQAYAERVAERERKAVYGLMRPFVVKAKGLEAKTKAQAKELANLRYLVETLQPFADMLKKLFDSLLGRQPDLRTPEGAAEAFAAIETFAAPIRRRRRRERREQAVVANPERHRKPRPAPPETPAKVPKPPKPK